MKKTATLLTILLLIFIGIQKTQAQTEGPTEEETIAWIKEKLERYGGYKYDKVEVTACEIIEYIKMSNGEIGTYSNPTSVKQTYKIENGKIKFEYIHNATRAVTSDGIKMISEGISLTNSEANLGERMHKAIKHLASFCEEKEEAF